MFLCIVYADVLYTAFMACVRLANGNARCTKIVLEQSYTPNHKNDFVCKYLMYTQCYYFPSLSPVDFFVFFFSEQKTRRRQRTCINEWQFGFMFFFELRNVVCGFRILFLLLWIKGGARSICLTQLTYNFFL